MSSKPKIKTEAQNFKEYNSFIQQLDISNIRIVSAKFEVLDINTSDTKKIINCRLKSWHGNKEGEFDAYQRYNVTVKDDITSKLLAKLSVTFCVTYSSEMPMNDNIFGIFEELNLRLNTWPYFREFAHDCFARMGWLGIIAPTYKVSKL